MLSSPLAVIRSVGVQAAGPPLRCFAHYPSSSSSSSSFKTIPHVNIFPAFFFFPFFSFRNIQISLSRITGSACCCARSAVLFLFFSYAGECYLWINVAYFSISNLLCIMCARVFACTAPPCQSGTAECEAPVGNRHFPPFSTVFPPKSYHY